MGDRNIKGLGGGFCTTLFLGDTSGIQKSFLKYCIVFLVLYFIGYTFEINAAVYIWLYRNDKEWINNNSPVKRSTANINKRVDWEVRDIEILDKVKTLVEIMLNSYDKPESISVGLIGKKLGINSLLEKHLGKMPQTKEYIEAVRESNKDFNIREIKRAISELDKEGQEILHWKVFRKVGIREEYPFLKDIIENETLKLEQCNKDYEKLKKYKESGFTCDDLKEGKICFKN